MEYSENTWKIGDRVRATNEQFIGVIGTIIAIDHDTDDSGLDYLVEFYPQSKLWGHQGSNGYSCKNGWWYDGESLELTGSSIVDRVLNKYLNEM
jgi:hypothetical protein